MSLPKAVLVAGALIGAGLCLYPPFLCRGTSPREVITLPGGHYSIFSPPEDDRYNSGRSEYVVSCRIDGSRLSGQLILLAISTVTLAAILYSRKRAP